MLYRDSRDNWQRLTDVQRIYLGEAHFHDFKQGWAGFNATQTVRLLEERGLIILNHDCDGRGHWKVRGVTRLGREVYARWESIDADQTERRIAARTPQAAS